jgi:hypothetical protein
VLMYGRLETVVVEGFFDHEAPSHDDCDCVRRFRSSRTNVVVFAEKSEKVPVGRVTHVSLDKTCGWFG